MKPPKRGDGILIIFCDCPLKKGELPVWTLSIVVLSWAMGFQKHKEWLYFFWLLSTDAGFSQFLYVLDGNHLCISVRRSTTFLNMLQRYMTWTWRTTLYSKTHWAKRMKWVACSGKIEKKNVSKANGIVVSVW